MRCRPEAGIAAADAADVEAKEVEVMPGFDGRGPMGAGPMTGGGRGFCNPARNNADFVAAGRLGRTAGFGRGLGLRRGCGFGFGRGAGFGRGLGSAAYYPSGGYAPYYGGYAESVQDEATTIRRDAEYMKQQLDAINRRIEELEGKTAQV